MNATVRFLRWFIFVLFLWVSVYPFLHMAENARLLREGLHLCEEMKKLPLRSEDP
jgi:hypothetical protein